MNPGYYKEEDLIIRDRSYTSYYGFVPWYGLLKTECEGEPEEPTSTLKRKKKMIRSLLKKTY